ncbi:MAG: MATE family efflux transporter [Phycisphaerales bacterium]
MSDESNQHELGNARSASPVEPSALSKQPLSGHDSAISELLRVAVPAVATMTSYTVMQFVDKLIVKEIGPDELAAVGNGGIAAFIPGAMMMGLLGVINTFVSQNLGAGRPQRGSAYAWNGLYLSVLAWLVVFVPFAIFLPQVFLAQQAIFDLTAPAEAVSAMQNQYGSVLLLGMIFTLGSRSLGHFFYGIHKPSVVMVSAITGNIVNVLLCNYLVLGRVGLPFPGAEWQSGWEGMGVLGAALSTVAGGVVELIIPFALFLSRKTDAQYHTRRAWRYSFVHVKDILRIGWPAGLMSANELVCWFVFMTGFVAHFDKPGEPAVNNAAGWITLQYMHLSFMPAVGISIALTAIVGKYIGAKRLDIAVKRAWLGLGMTVVYMSICAALFVIFRHDLVRLFVGADYDPEVAAEIIEIGSTLLILAAAFQLFDAVAISLSGVLRGAGDTVWPGAVTMILSWGIIVGGGKYFITYHEDLGSLGPWIAAAAFIIALSIAFFARFLGGKWKHMKILREHDADEAGLGGALPDPESGYDLAGYDPASVSPQQGPSPS